MKTVGKMVLTLVALLSIASTASAVDKLIVNNSTGTAVFKVDDTGAITTPNFSVLATGVLNGNGFKFDPTNAAAKKFGLGTTNPQSTLHLAENAANFDRGLTMAQHVDGAAAAIINIKKSRGTESLPTAVIQGDNIAAFHAQAYDGTAWQVPASLFFTTDGAVSTGNVPAALTFWTGTGTAATQRFERLRVSSNGNVGIGTSAPAQKLEVNGGVRINTATARPVCDTNALGTLWVVQDTAVSNQTDSLSICARKAGVLNWYPITF